jgi:hypothetical protein
MARTAKLAAKRGRPKDSKNKPKPAAAMAVVLPLPRPRGRPKGSGRKAIAAVRKDTSKTRFSCSSCGQNCWGKPDLMVGCLACSLEMKAA